MSRYIVNDSYEPSRRRVTVQSHQPSDSSSRRNMPTTLRDFASHSNVYPNSTRLSSNRMHNVYDDPSGRRYRLENPSMGPSVRQPQSYDADHQDHSHASNRHYFNSQQPSTDYSSPFQLYRHDRRHHREETHHPQSYPQHSSHRSADSLLEQQHSNPVRYSDHPSYSLHNLPINRSSDPASILNNVLQTFFGERNPAFHNNDVVRSTLDPMDLFAAALMMGRPDTFTAPGALHIHFGDLFDLLPRGEPPSVGLSGNDIERLPTMTYRKTSKSSSTDEKCAICLSEYKNGETVKRLRCKHFFHPNCIDPWLKTSTQCPICRGQQTD
ncbi:unnamed protein product [Rotaria magnacalcarata]|uniref:RING-type domain-containing protein n=1 Tax=Rotaria magnacalcarata TaxID=392030 RepID=A0A816MCQ3_9BILA|nr:unnamed protein product [Rotaria magnacalcarata]CAF4107960.1 unnamed protein product [Rotaria magnacalcarata]